MCGQKSNSSPRLLHLLLQEHRGCTSCLNKDCSQDSQSHPSTECLLQRMSCRSQEVRAHPAGEDRPTLALLMSRLSQLMSRLVQLMSRLRNISSCLHAGGSDSSLRWSSTEHREDSHSQCYRSQNLVLHPLSHPPCSLAQTRLARSPPGPTPGPARGEEGGQRSVSYQDNIYLTA